MNVLYVCIVKIEEQHSLRLTLYVYVGYLFIFL